ncbi:MFS transporter [Salipaludibacillus sp. CUR1]|uniref:MFS transporter n=1 Tax=Salipaludibacillus sp. CUR1 TaxID=2820003 RepID=UPI001E2D9B6C|nr:MFS transporter [Salipaludibacillus sp. CUR1]MCE7792055.1 MFS transporter [Salipaludibacillus sp. CUR1]
MEERAQMIQPEAPERKKISNKEVLSYFSYGMGQCISFGLIGTYIMYFYTDILGISALAASTIFVIARTFDAANDPLMASIMDTRKSKHGKFRQYLLYMPFFIFFITIIAFLPLNLNPTAAVIFAGATYILWGVFYTLSDVPFWSMSAVMSQEPQERTKLVTYANLGVFVGIGIPTLLFTPLAEFLGGGSLNDGFFFAVVILSLMMLPFMFLGFKNTRERVEPPKERVRIRDAIKIIKGNKPMFIILATFFCNVFVNITLTLNIYFFTYNLGNASLMAAFGIISLVSCIGFFFIPMLTKYFYKKHILMTVLIADIIVRVLFFMTGYGNTTVVLAFLTVTMILYTATGPLISAMLAETIELTEVRTGQRSEAVTFSGQTFTGKLSVAIAGGATGVILTVINYVPNQAQSQGTLTGLFFVIALLPALGSIIRLVLMYFYKYTEKEFNEAVSELQWRKQQNPGNS